MNDSYLYVAAARKEFGHVPYGQLVRCTERHRLKLTPVGYRQAGDIDRAMAQPCPGVVIELVYGWPSRAHLRLARRALRCGRTVFFYWPREEAIEHIDYERLSSYWRLWVVVHVAYVKSRLKVGLKGMLTEHLPPAVKDRLRPYYYSLRSVPRRLLTGQGLSGEILNPKNLERRISQLCREELGRMLRRANPTPLHLDHLPSADHRLQGTGVYLRTDFWAQITSGGSYGHTCFVAKELAARTERFLCYMPHRYTMLDDLGLQQKVMPIAGMRSDELAIMEASGHYYSHLRPELERHRPAYIYERICLGNYAGARLSQELGIPYIAEYNGSENSMMRTFNGRGYLHEELYILAEAAAFMQATVISVVSEAVRDDLLKRGVSPGKILVNPNGADLQTYAPPSPQRKRNLRRELGFSDDDRVIAFTGTFGGWHGVDVLAAAIPEICRQAPQAKFLLIGDGNYKGLVDRQVQEHHLHARVHATGRVPQQEGARLLAAADIYVSPHNSHMVDSRFFGSPTKIFEYMAMGGGIVASELEQIGEVLSPGIRVEQLAAEGTSITAERAILCRPGVLNEFIAGVLYLVRNAAVTAALGRNARKAIEVEYSWARHVERLWAFGQEAASGRPQ